MTAPQVDAPSVVPQDRTGLPVRTVSDPKIQTRHLMRQGRELVATLAIIAESAYEAPRRRPTTGS